MNRLTGLALIAALSTTPLVSGCSDLDEAKLTGKTEDLNESLRFMSMTNAENLLLLQEVMKNTYITWTEPGDVPSSVASDLNREAEYRGNKVTFTKNDIMNYFGCDERHMPANARIELYKKDTSKRAIPLLSSGGVF
jgi:hypothetical protein